MSALLPFLLLAAAGSVALSPVTLLAGGVALAIYAWAESGATRKGAPGTESSSAAPPAFPTPAGETRVATLYLRCGKLWFRRAAK